MGFATTTANALLDAALGTSHIAAFPATVYVALSSTLPTNTGTNVTEPAVGAYARVAVTNNDTNFPAAAARAKANATIITFPTVTADWTGIGWFALYDAATAGTFLGWGALSATVTIPTGITPRFAIGALTATVAA
jgi:hypothetical protein